MSSSYVWFYLLLRLHSEQPQHRRAPSLICMRSLSRSRYAYQLKSTQILLNFNMISYSCGQSNASRHTFQVDLFKTWMVYFDLESLVPKTNVSEAYKLLHKGQSLTSLETYRSTPVYGQPVPEAPQPDRCSPLHQRRAVFGYNCLLKTVSAQNIQ